jgi:hypothetical protein
MSKIVKLTESDLNRIVKKVMNEAPITGQGGVRPNPANVTGQGGTSGPNAMVNVNLVIDCKRRVIQKTDISLLQQGNSMVINAFCTPSYRKPTGGK